MTDNIQKSSWHQMCQEHICGSRSRHVLAVQTASHAMSIVLSAQMDVLPSSYCCLPEEKAVIEAQYLRLRLVGRGHDANKREFIATMDAVDRELGAAGGPFFLGPELSMVDVVFAPFLERIAASILYYKGFTVCGGG